MGADFQTSDIIDKKLKFADRASKELAAYAEAENIEIVWDRFETMQPNAVLVCLASVAGPARVISRSAGLTRTCIRPDRWC